jgi:DNA-binding MarR family transcriptional regulator
MPESPTPDAAGRDAEMIAAALTRLRGRRMPRPPGTPEGGPFGGRRGMHLDGHGRDAIHGHGDGHMHGHGNGHRHGGKGMPFGGPARLRLLEALAAASAPLTIGEIAEAVSVDQPRASRLVAQGVDHELVRREIDPEDARRTRVALTERGRRIIQDFTGDRRQAVDAALAEFTEAERADLARLLTKLAESWPDAPR